MVPVRKFSTSTSDFWTSGLDHLDAFGGLQVESHATLVPVEEEVRRGLAVLLWGPGSRLVARRRVLHLDDVGAEVAQQRPAPGSRDHAGQIEHADAVEREGECGHGGYYTADGGLGDAASGALQNSTQEVRRVAERTKMEPTAAQAASTRKPTPKIVMPTRVRIEPRARMVARPSESIRGGPVSALDDLADLAINRYPHDVFLPRIWELRHSVTAYDAAYIALAEALDAPLVTRDSALASAPHRARVEVV